MTTIVDIKVMNDPNAVCWMIRCEQSEEDTEGDVREIMASIRAGHLTEVLFDEETGDEIPGGKMTEEQLREAAEGYISDYGRDGWSVSWVNVQRDPEQVQDRGDATKFSTLEEALEVARLMRTSDAIEVWGMV